MILTRIDHVRCLIIVSRVYTHDQKIAWTA